MRAIDVLGFAGGFTLGMVQAGFELVGKREHPGAFGAANCLNNRHLLGYNWELEVGAGNEWTPVEADVVFGNPPCSGFSVASPQSFRGADSKINHCMWDLVEYAAKCQPWVVAFESVTPAYTREDGRALMTALRARLEQLTGHRYNLHHVKHSAQALGGTSASRRRYFWVASIEALDFGVELPDYRPYPTLRDAIGDLEYLPLQWETQRHERWRSSWAEKLRHEDDLVDGHQLRLGNERSTARHLAILEDKEPWHQGERLEDVVRRIYDRDGELPDPWDPVKVEYQRTKGFSYGWHQPLRWRYDDPARVIAGDGLDNTVHPTQLRSFTHREVARIMGYPDDWLIEPLRDDKGAHAYWGKGITVQCGSWLGYWLRETLSGDPGEHTGLEVGDREYLIDIKGIK